MRAEKAHRLIFTSAGSLVSDLARADVVELVNWLVVAAPVGMLPLGGGGAGAR